MTRVFPAYKPLALSHVLNFKLRGRTANEVEEQAREMAERFFGGPVSLSISTRTVMTVNGLATSFEAEVNAEPRLV